MRGRMGPALEYPRLGRALLALESSDLELAAATLHPPPHARDRYDLWDRYQGSVSRRLLPIFLRLPGARCLTVDLSCQQTNRFAAS